MALLSQGCDGAEMLSLGTAKQSVDDFPLDQAGEKRNVLGHIEKIHEAGTCVEEFEESDTDGHAARISRFLAHMKLLLRENLPDQRHFEFEQQAEHRLLLGGGDHLADNRQIDGGQQEVRTVADVG